MSQLQRLDNKKVFKMLSEHERAVKKVIESLGKSGNRKSFLSLIELQISYQSPRQRDLQSATFARCEFQRIELINCYLYGAGFYDCLMRESSFINCIFVKSELNGSDFTQADLSNCDFRKAEFYGTKMVGADLSY